MPDRCHLANKYEDIINLQGAEVVYIVSPRAQRYYDYYYYMFVD